MYSLQLQEFSQVCQSNLLGKVFVNFYYYLERIANSAFEIVTRLNKEHFATIVRYGSFADLTVCITEFCKVSKYQKISLLAIAMLRGVIPVMLECPECSLAYETPKDVTIEDSMVRFWFPVLFGFYDIIMNGEDLEVRRLCVRFASLHDES